MEFQIMEITIQIFQFINNIQGQVMLYKTNKLRIDNTLITSISNNNNTIMGLGSKITRTISFNRRLIGQYSLLVESHTTRYINNPNWHERIEE